MKKATEQEHLPATLQEDILRAVRASRAEPSRHPARAMWALRAAALAACLALAAGAWWVSRTPPPGAGAHAEEIPWSVAPISDLNPAVLVSAATAREEWERMEDDVRRAADFLLARLDGGTRIVSER